MENQFIERKTQRMNHRPADNKKVLKLKEVTNGQKAKLICKGRRVKPLRKSFWGVDLIEGKAVSFDF